MKKLGFWLIVLLIGFYAFPFGTDLGYILLMENFGLTFAESTMWLYIGSTALILVGLYKTAPKTFQRYARRARING